MNYVCCLLYGFSSIGEASPSQREDPNSIPDPGHISLSWYLIIRSFTEFSEVDIVDKK